MPRSPRACSLLLLPVALVLHGCGDEEPTPRKGGPTAVEPVCDPRQLQDCTCLDGRAGNRLCALDGKGWEPCFCSGEGEADRADWSDGEAPAGFSYGRLPDGSGPFCTLLPTPGKANQAPP
ncbi:MAG: hypothetical protein FJ125_15680 [Deltaproteobacteria bacterium]|nr:hypothetical protein [Deltaproteobacteria bacterium]